MGKVIKGPFGTSGVGNAGDPLGIGQAMGGGVGQTMDEPPPPQAGAPSPSAPNQEQLAWQLGDITNNIKIAAGRLTTALPAGSLNDATMKSLLDTFGVLESNAATLGAAIEQIAGVSPDKALTVQKDMDEYQQQAQSFIEAVEGAIQKAVGEGATPLAGIGQAANGGRINWFGVGVVGAGVVGIGWMLWRMRK